MGLFGVYMALNIVAIGAAAPYFLAKAIDEGELSVDDPSILVGQYFFYGLLYVFFTKLIFQNFGFADFKQYLLQRIPKGTIFHFLLVRTAFHWTNIILLLGVIAYLVSAHLNNDYQLNLLSNAIVMIGSLYFVNYLAFLVDKYLSIKKWVSGLFILILLIISFLDFNGIVDLGVVFNTLYAFVISNLALAFIPLCGALLLYLVSHKSLFGIAYLEDKPEDSLLPQVNIKKGLFSRFGKVGELMELELKLIFRNKRSRTQTLIVLMAFAYPFILSGSDVGMGMKIFVALFTTGAFAMTYGQLLLSWNSDHFDLLLTRMDSIKGIFKAKYYLQCLSIILPSTFLFLYGFLLEEYFYLMPLLAIYHLGVSLFMYMFLASYNSKKINANKGASMNYEGMSLSLFLIMFPIFMIPMGFYLVFDLFGHPMWGFAALGVISLLGFIFHDKLIDICVDNFKENRYKIGAAFRKK